MRGLPKWLGAAHGSGGADSEVLDSQQLLCLLTQHYRAEPQLEHSAHLTDENSWLNHAKMTSPASSAILAAPLAAFVAPSASLGPWPTPLQLQSRYPSLQSAADCHRIRGTAF